MIKLVDWLQKSVSKELKGHWYHGIVKDNNDPEKRGRIKCEVAGLIEGSSNSLPWFYPNSPFFLGGAGNTIEFSVPEVGSEVVIEFPYNDIYFGFYTARWHSRQSHVYLVFDEDYPESYGWVDSQGTYFKVNKKKRFLQVHHTSGTTLKIFDDGTIDILCLGNYFKNITKNYQIEIDKDASLKVNGNYDVNAESAIAIKSASGIAIEAPTVSIKANAFSVVGNVSVRGNISASGTIIDTAGNTNHHRH